MKRRRVLLTAVGVVAAAGCVGDQEEGSTEEPAEEGTEELGDDDDSPIDAEPDGLLPPADLFGEEWEQDDNGVVGLHPLELEGETASSSFVTDDGLEGIDVEVTVFDSVDGAVSGFQDMRDADFEGNGDGIEDVEIASDAYFIHPFDSAYFRDANVIGMLTHTTDGSANTLEYAANWHSTWRS